MNITTVILVVSVLVVLSVLIKTRGSKKPVMISNFFEDVFINEDDDIYGFPVEYEKAYSGGMYLPLFDKGKCKFTGVLLEDHEYFIQHRDGIEIFSSGKFSLPGVRPDAIVIDCKFPGQEEKSEPVKSEPVQLEPEDHWF